eukprot:TRINITY_DN3816_c0_g1_i1.p1 TRINITY_DN3816_c0_g1~~TRINITY_DN3816_c0_g1_i1.p1  ORF type:complete len:900 (+),score=338.63 TRINITY_DN3816_c0_g1_i1:160-2859(+)
MDVQQANGGCDEAVKFESATELAQIISGVAFIVLAMWLIFGNTGRMATAHKATLEQRLQMAATINTATALFSGFFNILQLTTIDDFVLPRSTTFVLDLSRPVEWVLTCPTMQLALVLLGGARIPPYRRFMMPLMSVSVLLCGTASMFTAGLIRFAWYGFGLTLAAIMFYHNALQISENSEGTESVFSGSSDFRVLSIMLIVTWVPFPCWFGLSPEGFGVINDVVVIHMGWVVLNIVSKFSFIIYMQRVKGLYVAKLEATRELYEPTQADEETETPMILSGNHKVIAPSQTGVKLSPEMQLRVLVEETMASLCMRDHAARFMTVLNSAAVSTVPKLMLLEEDTCMDQNIPWNLVSAAKRRQHEQQLIKSDLGEDLGVLNGDDMILPMALPGQMGGADKPAASAMELAEAARMAASMTQEQLHVMEDKMVKLINLMEKRMEANSDTQMAFLQRLELRLVETSEKVGALQRPGEQVAETLEKQMSLLTVIDEKIENKAEASNAIAILDGKLDSVESKLNAANVHLQDLHLQVKEEGLKIDETKMLVASKADGLMHEDEHIKQMLGSMTGSQTETLAGVQKKVEDLQGMQQDVLKKVEERLHLAQEASLKAQEEQFKGIQSSFAASSKDLSQTQADFTASMNRSQQEIERSLMQLSVIPGDIQRLGQQSENSFSKLEAKVENSSQSQGQILSKIEATKEKVESQISNQNMSEQKVVGMTESLMRKDTDLEDRVVKKLEDMADKVMDHCNREVNTLSAQLKHELDQVVRRTATASDTQAKTQASQEEFMADARRMNMMLMNMMSEVQLKSSEVTEAFSKNFTSDAPRYGMGGSSSRPQSARQGGGSGMMGIGMSDLGSDQQSSLGVGGSLGGMDFQGATITGGGFMPDNELFPGMSGVSPSGLP